MDAAAATPGNRWGTAVALTIAVLALSVLSAWTLVVLPLALLLVALPSERRGKQAALGMLLGITAVLVAGGPLGQLSLGWALLLGGGFVAATFARPGWGVLSRALASAAAALALAFVMLGATDLLAQVDGMFRTHFASASALALESFGSRLEGAELAGDWRAAMERVARVQWLVFPGLLVLESLAALALAAWWADRIRGGDELMRLRPLRHFRFDDQLVWVLIAGLVLVAAPVGALLTRIGLNALAVMLVLYALRGLGIFVFLAGSAPSVLAVVFAVAAAIFLYPLAVTAAVLIGLGDTWLDVRGRAALAPRT